LTDTLANLTIGAIYGTIRKEPSEQSAIDDQSLSMFHDEVTHQIHLAMGSMRNPCSTLFKVPHGICLWWVQALFYYMYLIRQGQQPMQYCSSIACSICLWWDQAPFSDGSNPLQKWHVTVTV